MLIWFGCDQGIGQISREVFPGLVDTGTQDSSGLSVRKPPPTSLWLELGALRGRTRVSRVTLSKCPCLQS